MNTIPVTKKKKKTAKMLKGPGLSSYFCELKQKKAEVSLSQNLGGWPHEERMDSHLKLTQKSQISQCFKDELTHFLNMCSNLLLILPSLAPAITSTITFHIEKLEMV